MASTTLSSHNLVKALAVVYVNGHDLNEVDLDHRWIKALGCLPVNTARVVTLSKILELVPSENYIANFMKQHEAALMVPISFGNFLSGYGFRSLTDKAFTVITCTPVTLYQTARASEAMSQLGKDERLFVFGTPLLVAEGVLDAEALSLIYPWTYASLGSINNHTAQFISFFTNDVIVCSDNDPAGVKGRRVGIKNLSDFGVTGHTLELPSDWKDPGEILEALSNNKKDPRARDAIDHLSAYLASMLG